MGRHARPDRVIAVLGMHRSGTSALAGSLQQHGLFLGRHSERNRHNPRGNRENPDVARLNEDVLQASGGSWRDPPAVVAWEERHFERARAILAEYARRPLWGFKDPRTLLTIGGWLRLVPDLELVAVLRNPARVALSLTVRVRNAVTPAAAGELSVADPVDLWRIYNERLLDLRRRRSFPVLCFDDAADLLTEKLGRAAAMLGLDEATGKEPFFAQELRRQDADPVGLPPDAVALYEELRELSI